MDPKRPILLLVFTCNFFVLHVQKVVAGTVVSGPGERLPGVTIIIKSSIQGATTGAFGKDSLVINIENDVSHYSFEGILAHETFIRDRSYTNIALAQDVKELQETVVSGDGTQVEGDITKAFATIKSDELEQLPITRIHQAVQGCPSSVNVVQSSAYNLKFQPFAWEGPSLKNHQLAGRTYYCQGRVMDEHWDNVFTRKIIRLN